MILKLFNTDHLQSPFFCERFTVVSSCHGPLWVIWFDDFTEKTGWGKIGELAEVCSRKRLSQIERHVRTRIYNAFERKVEVASRKVDLEERKSYIPVAASVCPPRFITPPSVYLRGTIWPGRLKSDGLDVGSANFLAVKARSCAEIPVVVPVARNITSTNEKAKK